MTLTPTLTGARADDPGDGLPRRSVAKRATGIVGFDEMSRDGLPLVGVTAVVGDAGSGKTVFALQTLINGFRQRGERGILVLFEEQRDQIRNNFASFDWGIAEIEDDDIRMIDARLPLDAIRSGVFDLSALLAGLTTLITETGAGSIVFDGIDMLLSVLNNEALERQEIVRLGKWVRDTGVTALVTVKTHGPGARDQHRADFLQYTTDCIVVFQGILSATAFSRTLRITKFRGSGFDANPAPFVIGPSGIEVVGFRVKRSIQPIFSERVSSGVPRLDLKLDGGYLRGSCTLVSGAPGTCKTSLGASFLAAACLKGRRCLFVSFDEGGAQIVANMKAIGVDLDIHIQTGLLATESLLSNGRSPEEHYVAIQRAIDRQHPEFLVIDPLSAILKTGLPFAEMIGVQILEQAKSEGITVLCTSLLEELSSIDEMSASHVSTLADNWIHVSYQAVAGERNRALTIVKSRGAAHSNQVCELSVDSQGIHIVDVYSAEGDVLMGAARQQKLASDRREQVEKEVAERRRHFELDRTLAELSSLAAKAAQDLEWKQQKAALLDLNQKMIREAEVHDANDRMMFRTNRAERRSNGGAP